MNEETIINYSLVDTNMDVYIIKIKESDKHKFQLDHHLVYRTIAVLKRNNQAPVGKRSSGSSKVAAVKGSGVKWSACEVVQLLTECGKNRFALRCAQTPLSVWEEIASAMSKDCTPEQCREKFRNLKATYSKVKSGKAGQKKPWEHTCQMASVLDDVTGLDIPTQAVDPVDQENVSVAVAPTIVLDVHGDISINGASANETEVLSLNASEHLMTPNASQVAVKANEYSRTAESTHEQGSESINETEVLSLNASEHLMTPNVTQVVDTATLLEYSRTAESIHEQDDCFGQWTSIDVDGITITEAECHNLGVKVLPLDHHVQVVRPQAQILDKNNNRSSNHDQETIVIDSDSEDFSVCGNLDVSRLKVEVDTSDADEAVSEFVPHDDTENANDLTIGQATFFGHIGSASTPNFDKAECAEVRMTPPTKKTNALMFRSPTNKTPKRKISAIRLMWDDDMTDAFVGACVSRKIHIQKPEVPVMVWKEIKEELNAKGHTETWECYRAKFHQMNDYFCNSLLAKGGMVHGIMWPYYAQFCAIHDVPSDFELRPEIVEETLTPSKRKRIWTDNAEKLLISLYAERKDKFDGSKSVVRHSTLYDEIAGVMNEHNVYVSGKQCKGHMNELIRQFKDAYDASRKTGAGAPTFVHFEAILPIFHGSPTLVPPVVATVGNGLAYSIDGVSSDTSSHSGTRTRPCKSSTSTGRQSKKGAFKPWNQEVAERQLQLKEEENEQFRLMREGFEKRSAERGDMIQDLVKLAAWDLQMRMRQGEHGGSLPDLNIFKSLQM